MMNLVSSVAYCRKLLLNCQKIICHVFINVLNGLAVDPVLGLVVRWVGEGQWHL